MELAVSDKTLFVTNDFGPRAGGIETFIIGLIERLPKSSIIVYTSAQENSTTYDAEWLRNFGVEVIRDRAKILLPTPRVNRAVAGIVSQHGIRTVAFGAAAPLAWMSSRLRLWIRIHLCAMGICKSVKTMCTTAIRRRILITPNLKHLELNQITSGRAFVTVVDKRVAC